MSKGILFDHRSQDFYSFYIYSSPPTTKSTFYIYNIFTRVKFTLNILPSYKIFQRVAAMGSASNAF